MKVNCTTINYFSPKIFANAIYFCLFLIANIKNKNQFVFIVLPQQLFQKFLAFYCECTLKKYSIGGNIAYFPAEYNQP